MAKTEFLQIRLTPEDRERLRRAAVSDYLEVSTWARQAILQALEQWEAGHARPVRRVAEPNTRPPKRSK
jgi:hypothetical protein